MKRWLLIAGRLILAGIFLYSGYAKLRQPWLQFVVSIDEFKIVPENLLEPMARTLPWCEVALGIGLLSGLFARWFALISTLLLAVFTAAGLSAYARGLQVDCGCFGAGGDPIGPMWFAEHGGMVLFSLVITVGLFLMRSRRASHSAHEAPGVPEIA